jgi:hypothetical protein
MPAIITRGAASAKAFGWSGGAKAVTGQQAYTTAGSYSWVAPAGVTKISFVLIGGGGRAGGGLAYCNYCVTPGCSYAVVVGAGASATASCPGGTTSLLGRTATGGQVIGGQGNHGLCQGVGGYGPGGGAGGYTGNGGNGGTSPTAGAGGAGGGSYQLVCGAPPANMTSKMGGGGGVGILGAGSNGAAGTSGSISGKGGSGGANGVIPASWCTGASATGGLYGGGGGYGDSCSNWCGCVGYQTSVSYFGIGAAGAARIIWPANVRFYPSTRTADE